MLSNKLKIKELVGSYWAEPLFFMVQWSYPTYQWVALDWIDLKWYFYVHHRYDPSRKEFWGIDNRGRASLLGRSYMSYPRFTKANVWNFWKDAIYDPKGTGKLKPNAQQ